jgi:hydroxyacylglutathione hydrolase
MIEIFPSGPILTNSYLIICPETGDTAVVDPSSGSLSKLAEFIEANNLTPKKILLTHSHWDHIADACAVKEKWAIPLFVHPLDRKNVELPGSDGVPSFIEVKPTHVDGELKEGDSIEVGSLKFRIIHTPGHSPGSICFYSPDQSILISGDTLFQGSIGILSIPGGDPEAMWLSLDKLSILPSATKVFPGHGEPTTIGAESWLPKAKEIFG